MHLQTQILTLLKTSLLFEFNLREVHVDWCMTPEEIKEYCTVVRDVWKTARDGEVKRRCVEICAVLLYRGEIELLQSLFHKQGDKHGFFVWLVDELNTEK